MTRLDIALFILISSISAQILAREFTEQDVRIWPSKADPPFQGAFKCFTCNSASDNYECNTQSPDEWCDEDTHYCKTVHTYETDLQTRNGRSRSSRSISEKSPSSSPSSAANNKAATPRLRRAKKAKISLQNTPFATAKFVKTLQVKKSCAKKNECHGLFDQTTCVINPTTGQKQCSKCCDGHVCNMDIPYKSRGLVINHKVEFIEPELVTVNPYLLELQKERELEELRLLKMEEARRQREEEKRRQQQADERKLAENSGEVINPKTIAVIDRIVTRNTKNKTKNSDDVNFESSARSSVGGAGVLQVGILTLFLLYVF